jgi:hypothetical protein
MPLIDVTEVLTDPDFATTVTLRRMTETVTTKGRASLASADSTIVGVVTPDRAATLQRQAEGANVSGSITLITKTRLIPSGSAYGADEIVWNGWVYTVMSVADCSQYGTGFYEASCDLKVPA